MKKVTWIIGCIGGSYIMEKFSCGSAAQSLWAKRSWSSYHLTVRGISNHFKGLK